MLSDLGVKDILLSTHDKNGKHRKQKVKISLTCGRYNPEPFFGKSINKLEKKKQRDCTSRCFSEHYNLVLSELTLAHILCSVFEYYGAKEEPQPQVEVTFGFLMTNCAPLMSSL